MDPKETTTLDGEIEGILRGGHITLGKGPRGRCIPNSEADLQWLRTTASLRGRRGGGTNGFRKEVFEIGARPLEARRAAIGEVVGDHVQLGLLGFHSGGGSVEGSKHAFSSPLSNDQASELGRPGSRDHRVACRPG